jgi:hypothetical protein
MTSDALATCVFMDLEHMKLIPSLIFCNMKFDSGVYLYPNLYYLTRFELIDDEEVQKYRIKMLYYTLQHVKNRTISLLIEESVKLILKISREGLNEVHGFNSHHAMFSQILPLDLYEIVYKFMPQTTIVRGTVLTKFLIRMVILLVAVRSGNTEVGGLTAQSYLNIFFEELIATNYFEANGFKNELINALLSREVFTMFTYDDKITIFKKFIIDLPIILTLFNIDSNNNTNNLEPLQFALSIISVCKNDIKGSYILTSKQNLRFNYKPLFCLNDRLIITSTNDVVKKAIVIEKMFNMKLIDANSTFQDKQIYRSLFDPTVNSKTFQDLHYNDIIKAYSSYELGFDKLIILIGLYEKTHEYDNLLQTMLISYFANLNSGVYSKYETLTLAWLSTFFHKFLLEYNIPAIDTFCYNKLKQYLNYMIFMYNYTITFSNNDHNLVTIAYEYCSLLITLLTNNIQQKRETYKILYNCFYFLFYIHTGIQRKARQPTILPYCLNCYKSLKHANVTKFPTLYQCNHCFHEHLYIMNINTLYSSTSYTDSLKFLMNRIIQLTFANSDNIYLKKLTLLLLGLTFELYVSEVPLRRSNSFTLTYFSNTIDGLQLSDNRFMKLASKYRNLRNEVYGELLLNEN